MSRKQFQQKHISLLLKAPRSQIIQDFTSNQAKVRSKFKKQIEFMEQSFVFFHFGDRWLFFCRNLRTFSWLYFSHHCPLNWVEIYNGNIQVPELNLSTQHEYWATLHCVLMLNLSLCSSQPHGAAMVQTVIFIWLIFSTFIKCHPVTSASMSRPYHSHINPVCTAWKGSPWTDQLSFL